MNGLRTTTGLLLAGLALTAACESRANLDPTDPGSEPPFAGTIFLDPEFVRDDDPTVFADTAVTYQGQESRQLYDRRVDTYITVDAHVFDVRFTDGITTEVLVNPEFDQNEAVEQVERYLPELGKMPATLRQGVDTVWVNAGFAPIGGAPGALLIHTEQAFDLLFRQFLDELLLHETVHSALDSQYAEDPDWLAAQTADPNFISEAAQARPELEDLAESFTAWVASRHLRNRLEGSLILLIEQTIPNRLDFFDGLGIDMSPLR